MILQMHALKSNLKPAKALKARALIAKTLRVNHTRYVHAYPTFRIPCSTIENSEIRELIDYMVCSVNHDEELQHLLLSNTRIISTAHKSIAALFHNHIGFAKADPAVTPTACTCARHTDLPRQFKLKDGTQHVGMKLTDLDTHHPLSILNQCSRNIPVPCTDHQLNSLIIAFRDFLEDAIQARVSELREFLGESWCSDA